MKQEAEERKAAIAAAQILQTEQGKVLMNFLEKKTVHQSNLPSSAADGQSMAMLMAHLEGEKNLFRYIKLLIKKGGNLNE